MLMVRNHTAYGRLNEPHSVVKTGYGLMMKKSACKTTLWENVLSLMKAKYGDENLTKLSKESKVGPGTMSRIKDQETSVGIDVLEKLCTVFKVQPWQLLAENLGEHQPIALVPPVQAAISFDVAVQAIAERLMDVDEATGRRAMGLLADLATDPNDYERLARATLAVIETGKRRAA